LELESFGGAEGADYRRDITLVGVYFGVEVTHVFGGDFVSQVGQGGAELGEFG
jgi:hypothetical protein